ncbi:hypothetical protein M0802_008621 [Mischocyttarus mexicanus]|nr:hypothetical protein M0802_008621 [Mischocyttarus mexicanus]
MNVPTSRTFLTPEKASTEGREGTREIGGWVPAGGIWLWFLSWRFASVECARKVWSGTHWLKSRRYCSPCADRRIAYQC